MGGEKKPLGMSELGCADGCGRRGCKGVAGNGRMFLGYTLTHNKHTRLSDLGYHRESPAVGSELSGNQLR